MDRVEDGRDIGPETAEQPFRGRRAQLVDAEAGEKRDDGDQQQRGLPAIGPNRAQHERIARGGAEAREIAHEVAVVGGRIAVGESEIGAIAPRSWAGWCGSSYPRAIPAFHRGALPTAGRAWPRLRRGPRARPRADGSLRRDARPRRSPRGAGRSSHAPPRPPAPNRPRRRAPAPARRRRPRPGRWRDRRKARRRRDGRWRSGNETGRPRRRRMRPRACRSRRRGDRARSSCPNRRDRRGRSSRAFAPAARGRVRRAARPLRPRRRGRPNRRRRRARPARWKATKARPDRRGRPDRASTAPEVRASICRAQAPWAFSFVAAASAATVRPRLRRRSSAPPAGRAFTLSVIGPNKEPINPIDTLAR